MTEFFTGSACHRTADNPPLASPSAAVWFFISKFPPLNFSRHFVYKKNYAAKNMSYYFYIKHFAT